MQCEPQLPVLAGEQVCAAIDDLTAPNDLHPHPTIFEEPHDAPDDSLWNRAIGPWHDLLHRCRHLRAVGQCDLAWVDGVECGDLYGGL